MKIGHGTRPCLIRNSGDVLLLLSRLLSNVMMTVTDGRMQGMGMQKTAQRKDNEATMRFQCSR